MTSKVIDVSSNQRNINWALVRGSGVQGAILRIIIKNGSEDPTYRYNIENCERVGMPITGVYNYSYATDVAKAMYDAKNVVKALNGRKCVVYQDIEDNVMKGLGHKLVDIIKAYKGVIESAGLEYGIYSGLSFYNSYIKPYSAELSDIGFWIARYPSKDMHGLFDYVPSASKQPKIPNILVGWQYSSKLNLIGVNGVVDVSDWYYATNPYNGGEKAELKAENPYSEPTRLLRVTRPILTYGNEVKWVQWHLVRLGYLPALNEKGKTNIDGWFGTETASATLRAQRAFGITQDAIVGKVTRQHLQA